MARTRKANPIDESSKFQKGKVVLLKVIDQDEKEVYYFAQMLENGKPNMKNISGMELTKESETKDFVDVEENGKFFFTYDEIVREVNFDKIPSGGFRIPKDVYYKYIKDDDSMEEEEKEESKPVRKAKSRKKAAESTPKKTKKADTNLTQVPEEEKDTSTKVRKRKSKDSQNQSISQEEVSQVEEKKTRAKKKTKIEESDEAKGIIYVTLASGKRRKVKLNKDIVLVQETKTFQDKSNTPSTDCCSRCVNKELVRAALTKNHTLLKNLISSGKISSFHDAANPLQEYSAIEVMLMLGDQKGLEIVTKTLQNKNFRLAPNVVPSLKHYNTGYNEKYAYGVKTRKVAMARGGREGNNALAYDVSYNFPLSMELLQMKRIMVSCQDIQAFEYFVRLNNYEHLLDRSHESAIRSGNYKLARFIIQNCLKRGGYGFSELHNKVLLDKPPAFADVKKVNCTKKAIESMITPLHCAAINPNAAPLKKLLEISMEFNVADFTGKKPVHYAAACEGPEPLKVLLSEGVDSRDGDFMKDTPLIIAARYGRLENVKVLLAEDNRSNVKFKNKVAISAIHEAAKGGHQEIISLLMAKGVDINFTGQYILSY